MACDSFKPDCPEILSRNKESNRREKKNHAFVHLLIPLFISQTLNTRDIHQETSLSAQNMFLKLFTCPGVRNLFHILPKCL